MVTHDPVFAQAADRQIFIVEGHLEQPGKAAEHFEVGSRPKVSQPRDNCLDIGLP